MGDKRILEHLSENVTSCDVISNLVHKRVRTSWVMQGMWAYFKVDWFILPIQSFVQSRCVNTTGNVNTLSDFGNVLKILV